VDDKFIAMECVMLLMGAINLTRIHASNIRRRRNYWMASVVLLVALYGYIFLGIYETTQGEHFDWIYMNILEPINTTMFALIAFYIASAAYRAFRVRSAEATVLLVAGIIVMLARAPIGEAIWSQFPVIGSWIMDIPNTAAMRAIGLGASLGGYATLIRVLLGLERSHLGGTGA
jgi:fermentation-respiration switch protein FrsA (DUF1100 family)